MGSTATERRERLRAVLAGDRCVSPATVWDALSARAAETAGYAFGVLSGSVCAATTLGAPDMSLHTLTEFAHQVRLVSRATDLSLFVDADQGFGNALNAMRTVEELEHAGVAGLAIEDLVAPPRFGAQRDELVSIGEMTGKLRAALAARRDPALIVAARTAAVKHEPIASVVERARAYAATGVDALFVTGLKKLGDLDAIRAAIATPILCGSAPTLSRADLEARGVRFCLQGHPAVAGTVKALHDIYAHLLAGGAPADLKPKLADDATMDRVLRVAQHDRWRDDWLS